MGIFEDGLDSGMAETNRVMRENDISYEQAYEIVTSAPSRDPTYDKEQIRRNGVWGIAFIISEMVNDGAPMGWSRYIPLAKEMLVKARKI